MNYLSERPVGYRLVHSEARSRQGDRDLVRHPVDLTEHDGAVLHLQAEADQLNGIQSGE